MKLTTNNFTGKESNALFLQAQAYMSKEEQRMLLAAVSFGEMNHWSKPRDGGNPFFSHPLAVAQRFVDQKAAADLVIAAVLHDVVEDTEITIEEVETVFGPEIAFIVDALTKEEQQVGETKEACRQRTHHKLLRFVEQDPRVLLVKLADRRHNLETLAPVPLSSKQRTISETLDFYVPLARAYGYHDEAQILFDLANLWAKKLEKGEG